MTAEHAALWQTLGAVPWAPGPDAPTGWRLDSPKGLVDLDGHVRLWVLTASPSFLCPGWFVTAAHVAGRFEQFQERCADEREALVVAASLASLAGVLAGDRVLWDLGEDRRFAWSSIEAL